MKTHNAVIYHCESCGRVVHAELGTKPPQCCGTTMGVSGGETIQGDVTKENAGGPVETEPPEINGRKKPR